MQRRLMLVMSGRLSEAIAKQNAMQIEGRSGEICRGRDAGVPAESRYDFGRMMPACIARAVLMALSSEDVSDRQEEFVAFLPAPSSVRPSCLPNGLVPAAARSVCHLRILTALKVEA